MRTAIPSMVVRRKSDLEKAKDLVAAFHEKCLRELTEHVAGAIDQYRAGDIGTLDVEAIIHQYHRASTELWKFCWASGGSDVRTAAQFIEHNAANEEVINWWERGAPRGQ
jgi:hypothetical protein